MASDLLHRIAGHRAGEISASVEAAIRSGELSPGAPLPSVRRLAEHLRVSPTTAAAAYRDLQIRGLVTAAGRRGTRVSPRPPVRHLSPAAGHARAAGRQPRPRVPARPGARARAPPPRAPAVRRAGQPARPARPRGPAVRGRRDPGRLPAGGRWRAGRHRAGARGAPAARRPGRGGGPGLPAGVRPAAGAGPDAGPAAGGRPRHPARRARGGRPRPAGRGRADASGPEPDRRGAGRAAGPRAARRAGGAA